AYRGAGTRRLRPGRSALDVRIGKARKKAVAHRAVGRLSVRVRAGRVVAVVRLEPLARVGVQAAADRVDRDAGRDARKPARGAHDVGLDVLARKGIDVEVASGIERYVVADEG